jgi:hypothetical protein
MFDIINIFVLCIAGGEEIYHEEVPEYSCKNLPP